MKRKWLVLVLIGSMLCSFTGCSNLSFGNSNSSVYLSEKDDISEYQKVKMQNAAFWIPEDADGSGTDMEVAYEKEDYLFQAYNIRSESLYTDNEKDMKENLEDMLETYGKPYSTESNKDYTMYRYQIDPYDTYEHCIELIVYKDSGKIETFRMLNFSEEKEEETVSTKTPDQVKNYKKPGKLSDDPEDFIMELDGALYQYPFAMKELVNNGWKTKTEDYTQDYVSSNGYGSFTLTKGDKYISVSTYNNEPNAVTNENSIVSDFFVGYDSDEIPVTICGGLTVGGKEGTIEPFFKQYKNFKVEKGEDYDGNTEYKIKENSDDKKRCGYVITAKDGKIVEISVNYEEYNY